MTTVLRTRELMARLGYRDKKSVLALFRGEWSVPGGTMMLPGRGKAGYEYALPLSFFEEWLRRKAVAP